MLRFIPFARALRKPRLRLLRAVLALTLMAVSGAKAQSSQAESIDALHAAFLFNFAKFTTWPTVSDLDTSIKFCVQTNTVDQDAFAGWGKKRIQNRPVRVAFFDQFSQGDLANCSIMFIGAVPEGIDIDRLRQFATVHHTLLVSDIEGFGARGGHIELYQLNRRLRFKVNLGAMAQAKLSLGAGVLNLAEIVETAGVPQ